MIKCDVRGVLQVEAVARGSRVIAIEEGNSAAWTLDCEAAIGGRENEIRQQRIVARIDVDHITGVRLVGGNQCR